MMNTSKTCSGAREREKEVVDILLDSDLYLEMDLAERNRLLHFIVKSYYDPCRN